jgi:hypothetical protein
MPAEQILIGLLTAGLCVAGIWRREWLLLETGKGKWLVTRYGKPAAVRIVTILLTIGLLGGLLLACNIIRPLRW